MGTRSATVTGKSIFHLPPLFFRSFFYGVIYHGCRNADQVPPKIAEEIGHKIFIRISASDVPGTKQKKALALAEQSVAGEFDQLI